MRRDISNRNAIDIYWLGQAGFWIDMFGSRILIDPYLSDSLAKKYAGKLFPHKRMMPPPITVDELPKPDIVLVTHTHTDHMDPETLGPLTARFPDVPIVIPVATRTLANERIGNDQAIQTIDAGMVLDLAPGIQITAFASAHEDFDITPDGHHPYLGYGIAKGERRIYHSGDTVPYEGLSRLIGNFHPEIALLPINGRDAFRKKNGVPGNMTASEAVQLCLDAQIAHLIPHHFGMFEFNTSDPKAAEDMSKKHGAPTVHIPKVGTRISFV